MELESIKLLKEKAIKYRLIELNERAISVQDVIKNAISSIHPDEICKTILVTGPSKKNYAILLLGKDMIDSSKFKTVIGKFKIAKLSDVKEAKGILPGEVCPITLEVPLLVDLRVMEKPRINFGSGNKLFGLEIDSQDLEKIVEYKLVDVVKKFS